MIEKFGRFGHTHPNVLGWIFYVAVVLPFFIVAIGMDRSWQQFLVMIPAIFWGLVMMSIVKIFFEWEDH